MYQRRHAFENYYFATPVNPVMESTPRSIAHTGVAMPNAEFGPLQSFPDWGGNYSGRARGPGSFD